MAAPTSQTNKLPTIPSEQGILKDDHKSLISLPWIQWFISLSAKINAINVNVVGWGTVPIDSGVTPGNYINPSVTVDIHGLITVAANGSGGGGGGNATFINPQTGISYTVAATDIPSGSSYKGVITMSSSSINNVYLPLNATVPLPIGSELQVIELGTGQTTIASVTGVILVGAPVTGTGQNSQSKAIKILTDTWFIYGALPHSSGSDPYFSNVSALLHFDGTDGGIVFTDQIGNTWTPSGTVTTSTTNKKFGTASGSFLKSSNGYLTSSTSAGYTFGTGNFTIECWGYFNTTSTRGLFSLILPGNYTGISIVWDNVTLAWQLYNDGANPESATGVGVANTWYALALVRSGSSLKFYVNGIAVITTTTTINITTNTFYIGTGYTGGYTWDGYIDEFRVTKGIARYTANYTPTTNPFHNS